ncbi:hypothetical protein BDW69DRAFT_164313 [Aspergillus filifer]
MLKFWFCCLKTGGILRGTWRLCHRAREPINPAKFEGTRTSENRLDSHIEQILMRKERPLSSRMNNKLYFPSLGSLLTYKQKDHLSTQQLLELELMMSVTLPEHLSCETETSGSCAVSPCEILASLFLREFILYLG